MLNVVVLGLPHLLGIWHGARRLARLGKVPTTFETWLVHQISKLNLYQFCTPRAHCEIPGTSMFTHTVAATDRALSDAWLLAAKKMKKELDPAETDDGASASTDLPKAGADVWVKAQPGADDDVRVGARIRAFLAKQAKRRPPGPALPQPRPLKQAKLEQT